FTLEGGRGVKRRSFVASSAAAAVFPRPFSLDERTGFVFLATRDVQRLRSALVGLAFVLACEAPKANASSKAGSSDFAIDLTDDAGFALQLRRPAQRIVSLIPSATETLIAVGATQQIVGRTRYDVAPEVAALPSVGGGFDPSIETIVNLHPDLVIAWESDKRQTIR